MAQQSKAGKMLVDSVASAKRKGTAVKITGQPLVQITGTRILKVPAQDSAETLNMMTMSKEEIKQIVHDTVTNHPKIQAIDEKLTRLLRIIEQRFPPEQTIIPNSSENISRTIKNKGRDGQGLRIDVVDYLNNYREIKMTYFPVKNPDMMARVEDVLFKNPNDQLKIVRNIHLNEFIYLKMANIF
jgi:dGTP triphosphohydrolase